MKLKSRILLLLLICMITLFACVEKVHAADTLRIDKARLLIRLNGLGMMYTDASHKIKPEQLENLVFKDTIPKQLKIRPTLVQQDLYLKFVVANKGDTTIGFYFFPGIYFEEIKIYTTNKLNNVVEEIIDDSSKIDGFKKLKLDSNETKTFFVKLKFTRTNTNSFLPVLVRDFYQNGFLARFQTGEKGSNTMTFLFSGLLLMMIVYSMAVYALNRNTEFIYYSAYAFFLGSMFFLKSYLFNTPSDFNNFFEAYLDFIMQSLGTFIYLSFLKKFIDTKNDHPWLHKLMIAQQAVIVTSLALFSYLFFFTDNYNWQNNIESYTKYIWVIGTFIFVIYTFNKKNKMLNYLAIGHSFLILGGFISLFLISSPSTSELRRRFPGPLTNALSYYELGLAIELMFFLTALAFKNKADIEGRTKERERLKLQTERQDLEKQLAVLSAQQDERNRISADMHDELGSGVTAIRLMSEILKQKLKDNVFPEIDKISNNANELIIKMNTLIWTMKSDNDSVESLVTYIRIYALEFFENTSIDCVVRLPPVIPSIELTGNKRRNLFLTVKETLNNVLKHSKADRVTISFSVDSTLLISITDNGIGIDHSKLRRFGSGLINMKKRIEGIDGRYKIENGANGGAQTIVELNV